jgi:hypothetical protein
MPKKFRFALPLIAMLCFAMTSAADESGRIELPEGVVLRPHMYGHFQSGQIEKGSLKYDDVNTFGYGIGQYKIDHVWSEDAVIEFGFDAIYRQQLKLAFTLGTKLYFSYPMREADKYTKNLRQDVFLGDLYAQYHIGDIAMPYFLGQVGFFRYKYNPECRNFGDYLFRTGTYPIWFDMGFDAPWQRLLGLHGQTNLLNSLTLDGLLVSSTVAPAMNWSVAFLANYDVASLHFIDIGAGVDFANLFSVYTDHSFPIFGGDLTTPKSTQVNNRYITADGDTAWYTFKGTKVMGRISIDPKVFIQWKEFGENDLKLYAEADIIGIKSYPDTGINQGGQPQFLAPSYNKLWQKMPVTIGFNLPTHPVVTYGVLPGLLVWWLENKFNNKYRLDILNVELEWFGARYYNDPSNLINYGSQPLPYNVWAFWDQSVSPRKCFLKWSVYAKKTFLNGHFSITGQLARDHMRLPCAAYSYEMWNELLVEAKDWGWYLKTSWMF